MYTCLLNKCSVLSVVFCDTCYDFLGNKEAFLWYMQIFGGWVATLIVAAVSAGIMTALLVYSPNKLMSDDRVYANRELNAQTLAMINQAGGINGPLGVRALSLLHTVKLAWLPINSPSCKVCWLLP